MQTVPAQQALLLGGYYCEKRVRGNSPSFEKNLEIN
jgi:hypothetical protein